MFQVFTFSLENEVGTVERAICECDKMLTFSLQPFPMRGMYQHYNEENCYRRDVIIPILEPSCCANADGYLTWYRAEANCCESDGTVLDAGMCLVDAGITYEERVILKASLSILPVF